MQGSVCRARYAGLGAQVVERWGAWSTATRSCSAASWRSLLFSNWGAHHWGTLGGTSLGGTGGHIIGAQWGAHHCGTLITGAHSSLSPAAIALKCPSGVPSSHHRNITLASSFPSSSLLPWHGRYGKQPPCWPYRCGPAPHMVHGHAHYPCGPAP